MNQWALCGHDMEGSYGHGLLKARNCPSFNHPSSFERQGKRTCHTKKISLKEKKSHMNVLRKVCPSQQRKRVAPLEKKFSGELFSKSNLRNFHLEKCYKKTIIHQTVLQSFDQIRMNLHSRGIKKWNTNQSEVEKNKPVLFNKKITINYLNSNNQNSLNPKIFWTEKKTDSKEIETFTFTQPRFSTIKTKNFDQQQKMTDSFIFSDNQLLNKLNHFQAIVRPYVGESCLKHTKSLDSIQFCKKAQSLANSEELEEQFSLVIDKFEYQGMEESIMKEPSTPETVSSELFTF